MIMNEKNYMDLMFVFDDYFHTGEVLTLFWKNGSILKGISELSYVETDTDIPESSPEYPGYYYTFLENLEIIFLNNEDLDFDTSYGSLEIDMLSAPMLVKVGDKIVWEKAEDK